MWNRLVVSRTTSRHIRFIKLSDVPPLLHLSQTVVGLSVYGNGGRAWVCRLGLKIDSMAIESFSVWKTSIKVKVRPGGICELRQQRPRGWKVFCGHWL